MSAVAAILIATGTTGLVAYLASRMARADRSTERPKSGD